MLTLNIYLSQKGTSSLFCSRVYANMYPFRRIYKNKHGGSDTKAIPITCKIILQKEKKNPDTLRTY